MGGDYRLIRRCLYCQNEVAVDGSVCWQCSAKAGRRVLSRPPWHKRITMRGYLVILMVFGAVVVAMAVAEWMR